MRYRVRHVTRFSYARSVDLAAHVLHLRPRALPGQSVGLSRIAVHPAPGRLRDGEDSFGNPATWMSHDAPHATLEIDAEAEVSVAFPAPPPAAETPAWETVAAAGLQAPEAAEMLFDSPMVGPVGSARDYAAASFPPGRCVLAGLLDLNSRIGRDFAFRAGVTTLSTPIAEVMNMRAGVCQDFAHLMIAGLRGVGLPARYTSGYIRTRPPPGQTKRRGADQSHAWVGAWLGARHGWVGLDPTNSLVVADEHVVLGWGRDYGDVSPVRGILLGGGAQEMSVNVDLEPI